MSISRQLYQLQEIDQEVESDEQTLRGLVSQLGESKAVVEAKAGLVSAQKRREELAQRQRALEGEVDDLASKIAAAEGQLYSGRIGNPKELANLQHEVELLKAKRDQLEVKALEVMEQAEAATASVAADISQLEQLEAAWRKQQGDLSQQIEIYRNKLSELKQRRQQYGTGIDQQAVAAYERIRQQKGQAVARVEQGICRGCRISLPVSNLQQARGPQLVHCSSCGRILFQP
jgi:predicted  nucleic acid-binding Zn-ribbon protein